MTQTPWNTFVAQQPTAAFFAASVSVALPSGPHLDKNMKKLPTPYVLFQEWAKVNLAGRWASTKMKGYFLFAVVDASDMALITNTFGLVGPTKMKVGTKVVQQLKYQDSSFKSLATALGYVI